VPRLIINRSGEASRVFEISGRRPISIGRAKSSNLVLDDSSISRLHAVVRVSTEGHWEIIDGGSVNGIKVNGKLIKEAPLRPDDEIIAGKFQLRFEEPDVCGILAQDTVQLPLRYVREIAASAYSESFLPVIPIGSDIKSEPDRAGDVAKRLRLFERENSLLTLLLRVDRTLGSLNTIPEIAGRVLDLVMEIEGSERGYAMLLEDAIMGHGDFDGGDYAFQPALLRFRHQSNDGANESLIISQSVINKVMQSGTPVLLTDAQSDPSFSASPSIVRSGIRSAMCAPLGTRDRRFGLLYVDNSSRRAMFTPEDLNVFAVIAMQAGLAIDRIRSRNEIAQQTLQLAALERFLSPEVAGKVVADASDLRLGGEKQVATLLFADIRGFTAIAEKIPPEQIVTILNGFFGKMTDVIFKYEGTIDKYLGDGLMCLFGAPFAHWNDALSAVRAAADMQLALADLNLVSGHPPLQMGIGIHSGEVIIGYMGTARRMDYTAIGDTVNVAARLTAEAEPDQILISAATWNMLRKKVPARRLPLRKLKGRGEPIETFEILWKEMSTSRAEGPLQPALKSTRD
jgi:adenylate cyclase